MTEISLLDLAPIVEGGDAAGALSASLTLARKAEALGFRRFWMAEHHNMPGVASAATAVALAHVAAGTQTIRIGAGGVMLPNHAPLVIAEQFGTLAALHPGRVDLGLGRAPGTDPFTSRALRRRLQGDADRFPEDVVELLHFLQPASPQQAVRAIPGAGADAEVWILGSSLFGAQLAAALGLPFAFASHFAPAQLDQALQIYRQAFQPSMRLSRPRVMAALTVIAADSDAEAAWLSSSLKQAFVALRSGRPGPLPPPMENYDASLGPEAQAVLNHTLSCAVIGGPASVRAGLARFAKRTQADELIVAVSMFDLNARLRSLELIAAAGDGRDHAA